VVADTYSGSKVRWLPDDQEQGEVIGCAVMGAQAVSKGEERESRAQPGRVHW
jgi:hypothetical protein